MFGVMRLTNTAQGDFIILGAFARDRGHRRCSGGAPLLVALAVLPVAFGFGYALQRYVLNGTLGKDPLPSLVVTFGLSIVIQNLLLEAVLGRPALDRDRRAQHAEPAHRRVAVARRAAAHRARDRARRDRRRCNGCSRAPRSGRSFRAVSDDREIAELMGLNAKKVYALATAIAFVLIAVAGALQGMRTTVSPSDGPLLLLFAFEAVIIGGMGSFWGTLAGAMILGRHAADRLPARPGLGHLGRPHRVPAGAGAAAAGAFPEDAWTDAMTNRPTVRRGAQHRREPRRAGWSAIALVVLAASLPFWGESSWMREFVEIACYFIFAMMWNLLAGYGGMVSIGQQAFFGFGGYVMLMLGNFAGVNPFVADSARRAGGGG